ncbi:MAG: S46 family peptidase [Bryobacterales bacterium]|nr:S46 family peptidase [Bryobacterales bacterium]
MRAFLAYVTMAAISTAVADEGIWLYNQAPKDRIRKKYGFNLTDEFLNRLRTASVRLNNGGSGSFVSPQGLIFTNHHVAMDCIQKVSSAEHDYMNNGFSAPKQADEKACPDLEVNILTEITDVTDRVQKQAGTAANSSAANRERKAAMTAIEKECSDRTGDRCDVVTLYSGGLYHLYRYKKYTDIRLVFAPEDSIAAFGGDPDNFTYPRYCLDFAFLRAYKNGKPAQTPAFLPWSKQGAREGELTFVSGHPGSTGRLATVPELEFNRDVSYPLTLRYLKSIIDTLLTYSAESAENKRIAQENLNSQQNSFKAFTGFYRGLKEDELMARKRDEEKSLSAGVAGKAELRSDLESTWSNISAATTDLRGFYVRYALLDRMPARGSDLFTIAREVYRYGAEKQKPNDKRLREFVDPALPSLEQQMYSTAPLYDSMEIAAIRNYLEFLAKELGPNDETVKRLLNGKTAAEAANEYVTTSRLKDVAERKRLANDPKAAEASNDGMIRLVRTIDAEARQLRAHYEDKVEAVITSTASKIAKARFAVYGTDDYPDATFTLRLSYGPVRGYTNEQGQHVPWATDFAGLYRRATGKEPFALPPSWVKAKKKLKLSTPFNFVTTNDTHGGNSGSPTVDTKGQVVGILFDGNIEGLPNRFVYREQRERSVHVASQGIVEALRAVYGAKSLLHELGVN